MKNHISFLLITALTSAGLCAQGVVKQESKVQLTVTKLFEAISKNDVPAIKSSCTKDVKFYEYGQIWTVDTLLQKLSVLASDAPYHRTNTFDFINTTIKGNTAWVSYYLESTIIKTGKPEIKQWMETVILIKEKKQWKISVLHSTRLYKN